MSEFTRPTNTDYARQSGADFNRQSNIAAEPVAPRPVVRPVLRTTGPILGSNDIAAFIASAVMTLGPLAGGAFWTH